MRTRMSYSWALIMVLAAAAPVAGQVRIGGEDSGGFGALSGLTQQLGGANPVTVSAQFTVATADRPAVLMITARIAPEWHVYSITQPPGGPTKTKFQLTPSPHYRLVGEFGSQPEPKSRIDQVAWIGLEIQEHDVQVTWYAPIELTAGVDPSSVEIRGEVRMLACKDICIPANADFVARLGQGVPIGPIKIGKGELASASGNNQPASPQSSTTLAGPTSVGSFQAAGSEVVLTGRVEPMTLRPGEQAQLMITATPATNWHVYAYADRDDQPGSKPTLIAFEETSGLVLDRPRSDATIKTDDSVPEFGTMRYYEGPVTWTVRVTIPADVQSGEYRISGIVGYQACETRDDRMGSCELPKGVRFQTTLVVGDGPSAANNGVTFTPATYKDASVAAAAWAGSEPGGPPPRSGSGTTRLAQQRTLADSRQPTADSHAYDLARIVVQAPGGSLGYYVLLAFIGGIILNLMPCVLPVIGLKVMSFVEQAGKSRRHALALNLWYAAGIVSVFLLLGFLAAWIGLSWGGQFGSTAFNVTLATLVFAMALSLLGVWEIPIPGFFGSGTAQELAAKEGPLGAFLKGMITTILATPCTGPFMATAIAWAVSQTTSTILVVFGSLGLGMASPYLVIGVFPELLRFMPKPGAWMETFKQLMGFVLLATVVFILTFIEPAVVVPTVALLVGIGLACWLVARTPLTAELGDRLQSWAMAGAVALLFAVASFGWLYPDVMLPRHPDGVASRTGDAWQPFTLVNLQRVAVEDGRTVLVDFSADWCVNCKVLEAAVLHTEVVERAIADAEAVTMYADFTDYPPEIERTIHALKSNGVPVIAIFPGSRPYEPIVFRGGYTKSDLLTALAQAENRELEADGIPPLEISAAASPLN